jgi:hypothetical protein
MPLANRIALTYLDRLNNEHSHSFAIKPYNWGIYTTQDGTAQQARFTGWANALKPLLEPEFNITSMKYINSVGAVVREVIPDGGAISGTHETENPSRSFTLGFGYSTSATGETGKAIVACSHVLVGHDDWGGAGVRKILDTANATIKAYKDWVRANLALGSWVNDASLTLRAYTTVQYNSHYQKTLGC